MTSVSLLTRQSCKRIQRAALAVASNHHHRHMCCCNKAFSSTASLKNDNDTDVLIVGGGVVGCALAQQLKSRVPSLRVGLVEARSAPKTAPSAARDDGDDDARVDDIVPPNPRSYALSPSSLELLGLDDPQVSPRLGFYDSMQIWEARQPAALIFQAQDIQTHRLGAVVEDSTIVHHLWRQIEDCCGIMENSVVKAIQLPNKPHEKARVTVVTKDGEQESENVVQTNLVVGADGAYSAVRRLMGIPRTQFEYGQSALTFTVELDSDHGGRAFQRFLETGPMALLPTFSPKHAIVVWSTATEEAAKWKDHPDLVRQVNALLHDGPTHLEPFFGTMLSDLNMPAPMAKLAYGFDKIIETAQYGPAIASQELVGRSFLPTPTILKTASSQFTFPLQTGQVHTYTDSRLALVGDAAHTMHPMAGQGLNLGLQDVANLADLIVRAADAGMDVATFLEDYERSRKWQVSLTLGGIHALQRMFGAQHVAAKHIKSLGMNAIQTVPPLRRALVDVACQGVANG